MTLGNGETRADSSGFFAIRAPVESVDLLVALGDGLESTSSAEGAGDARIERNLATVSARLMRIAREPAVRESLFVASSDLEHALDNWLDRPESDAGRRVEHHAVS